MTSQQVLENLCNEYVGFYRYAQAMEIAFEAERQKPRSQQPSGTIHQLPGRVKTMVTEALAQSATMEREMQCLADRLRRHAALGIHMDTKNFYADLARAADIGDQHKRWVAELDQVADAAREASVQPGAWQPLVEVFSAVNERIGKLMEIALAVNGAAKARQGA